MTSGDNFLASPEFAASVNDGTFYDARAIELLEYDALAIGNHEFDFGPELLADFVIATEAPPFLSANLDYGGEPALDALFSQRIFKSGGPGKGDDNRARPKRLFPSAIIRTGGQSRDG